MRKLITVYRGPTLQCDADAKVKVDISTPFNSRNVYPFQGSHKQQCDDFLLGQLERICRQLGIEPAPLGGYHGFALKTLCRQIAKIELCSLCDRINEVRSANLSAPIPTGHNVKKSLISKVDETRASITGLNMDDYRKPKKSTKKVADEESDLSEGSESDEESDPDEEF